MIRWVITGAASGFGRAVTEAALGRGDAVIAVDVDRGGLDELVGDARRLVRLQVDVRDAGAVERLGQEAVGGVDVLVNAAGYGLFGAQAAASLDAVGAMLDTNLLGAVRVTRALLPALLASRGCVVQLSSLAGRVTLPESGFYAASKHALEAVSEALFVEHAGSGLRVVLVEPGAFATGFAARAARSSTLPVDVARPGAWDALRARALAAPQDPALVVEAVFASVRPGGPGFQRVPVGVDARRLLRARDLLGPDAWTLLLARALGDGGPLPVGVATTAEVLATATQDEAPPAVAAAVAAWAAGLLPEWEDEALLAVLRTRAAAAEAAQG
ncbi:MAG: SDR family NAD(P)-dependent oxidoreductase [Alphaproteobacteria bacterium]|nr:SDR family NAD(P)-dependent oxidoreductase [Alphaproteobacteria bacterium]